MLNLSSTTNLTEKEVCKRRIVKAAIEKDPLEGIVWMTVTIFSFCFNAYALQSLVKKLKFKNTHRLYLGNVFLCNITVGSATHLCFMLLKFGCCTCKLRDAFFVVIVFSTNVNHLSVICMLACYIANCPGKSLDNNNRATFSRVIHIFTVVVNWVLSAIFVFITATKSSNNGVLIYTFGKIILIIVLGICALRYIYKGIKLKKKSDTHRKHDALLSHTAVIIMTVSMITTVIMWCPLLTMIALQNFKVVDAKKLASPLMIATRFVSLGPLIDPIFYFWSRKANRVSSARGQ